MNSKIELITNTSETRKGIKLKSGKQLDELPNKIVTGDTNIRIIHIDDINHVQYEGEGKYQEYQLNLVCVVRDKEFSFYDEKFIVI